MIRFANVTKEYPGGIKALSDINLEIEAGEFLFLIGQSGAGKTTLAKLLIREELPDEGEIYLEDWEITKLPRRDLPQLRRKVGVIFQDFKLLPQKTAAENIRFVLEVLGKTSAEIKKDVPSLLSLVDLAARATHFPEQLSGGEKQRLAIARTLAAEPQVLVADEPTGMIDPTSAWNVISLLNSINKMGTTVIMATHNAEVVNSLKRRVVELFDGKIIRDQKEGEYSNEKS